MDSTERAASRTSQSNYKTRRADERETRKIAITRGRVTSRMQIHSFSRCILWCKLFPRTPRCALRFLHFNGDVLQNREI